ncbi:hypothetical protein [Streptomyces erythrochromogenes]|uniref:hypothetical protein n=1 Tax=Streptomyces erythrochromogenes TaxID=285574 RepID=UPI0036F6B573
MSEIPREHLDRIEAKLDLVIDGLAQGRTQAEQLGTAQTHVDRRVRSLEKWRYAVGGSVFISLASIATSLGNSAPR